MRNFGNCSKIPPINNETIAVAVSAGIPEIDIGLDSLLNDCPNCPSNYFKETLVSLLKKKFMGADLFYMGRYLL